jgi:hypothetical protein
LGEVYCDLETDFTASEDVVKGRIPLAVVVVLDQNEAVSSSLNDD